MVGSRAPATEGEEMSFHHRMAIVAFFGGVNTGIFSLSSGQDWMLWFAVAFFMAGCILMALPPREKK